MCLSTYPGGFKLSHSISAGEPTLLAQSYEERPLLIEALAENRPQIDFSGGRKRVMVCVQRYLPGYQSGGPVRAVANMVDKLGDRFDFYVITRDRDATDAHPYPGITSNRWYRVGKAQVFYCSSVTASKVKRVFREVRPEVISLNSFQEQLTRIVIVLRRLGSLGKTPVLLAPRGEFSPGAMKIKAVKKAFYRCLTKVTGLYENLHWQVSAPPEKEDLLRAAPARSIPQAKIHVVSEVTDSDFPSGPHAAKKAGGLKLVFLSRISEMKNLDFVLDVLHEVRGRVELNIYGPVADWDAPYWVECQRSLEKLPANINARYHGSLDHSEILQALRDHHFFILPTKGENYCHAAVESFMSGTPVILSDRTPWVNLRALHVGFDIPLEEKARWIETLQICVDMNQDSYAQLLDGTQRYSGRFSLDKAANEHIAMFETTLNDRS